VSVQAAPGKTRWLLYTFIIVILLVVASYFSVQLLLAPTSAGQLTAASTIEQIMNAPEETVLFIYPEFDKNRTKPPDVAYASDKDFALCTIAGGIIFGMTRNRQLVTTDAGAYVDRQDGKPGFDGTIVTICSSQINAVARYYEASGQTPLVLDQDKDSLYIRNSTGNILESTRTSKRDLSKLDSDISVIEAFTDAQNRRVLMIWGYSGLGAVSSAQLAKFELVAQPWNYSSTYYVGSWADAKEGVSKNGIPDEGDTYSILSSGSSVASSAGTYVGWTEVAVLYLLALMLAGLGYSIRRGWITFEVQRG
jgi:hypothetical protein